MSEPEGGGRHGPLTFLQINKPYLNRGQIIPTKLLFALPPPGFSESPTSLNQQDTALSVRVCHTGLELVTLDPNKGVVEGGDQAEGTHGGHIREVRKGVLGIAYTNSCGVASQF